MMAPLKAELHKKMDDPRFFATRSCPPSFETRRWRDAPQDERWGECRYLALPSHRSGQQLEAVVCLSAIAASGKLGKNKMKGCPEVRIVRRPDLAAKSVDD
jgi:hypothetical protein